jgi:hypothetical protein
VTGPGVSCPRDCSNSYAGGSAVTLTAHPARGSRFAGWSGACRGRGKCSLTLSADRSVSARFTRVPPPNTRITRLRVKGHKATARFKATGGTGRSSFTCKLDKGRFRPCRSPKTYRGLKAGRHTLSVRAKDSLRRTDATPARRTFRIRP